MKNKIEHTCVVKDCESTVVLEWDNREFRCKCGKVYIYKPTTDREYIPKDLRKDKDVEI